MELGSLSEGVDALCGSGLKVFELFRNQWALVTAGGMDAFNSCTVSWGSLGSIWWKSGASRTGDDFWR